MYTIYHNPRCSKSRAGLEFLQSNVNDEIHINKYLNEGLDKEEIKSLLNKLDLKVNDIIRTSEKFYKENIKGKDLSDDQIIDFMIEEPKLLQRPIVVKGDKAVMARPAEEIEKLF